MNFSGQKSVAAMAAPAAMVLTPMPLYMYLYLDNNSSSNRNYMEHVALAITMATKLLTTGTRLTAQKLFQFVNP